jgi:hypothetical protein
MTQIVADIEETSIQVKQIAKSSKTKVTVYLPEEAEKALAELYIARYRNDRKADRSSIVAEAILAFAKQETR